MSDESLQAVEQVRQFLNGSEAVEFRGLTAKEKYCWIWEVLIRFSYLGLNRCEKGVKQAVYREGYRVFQPVVSRMWWKKESAYPTL